MRGCVTKRVGRRGLAGRCAEYSAQYLTGTLFPFAISAGLAGGYKSQIGLAVDVAPHQDFFLGMVERPPQVVADYRVFDRSR